MEGGRRGRGRVSVQSQGNPEIDIATVLANIQQRLEEQAALIQNLQHQGTESGNPENRKTKADSESVEQGGIPPNQAASHEPLYKRFCAMKPPIFEGSTNPLEAESWLSSIQVILNFMRLNDQEKVLCASFKLQNEARFWWETVEASRNTLEMSWEDFKIEFNRKFYNSTAMRAQQTEFLNLKQGTMTVAEAVRKFDQLARICPQLVPTEELKVRRMLDMFRADISLAIESSGLTPTSTANCVERAFIAEHRLTQLRGEKAKAFEAKKQQGGQSSGFVNKTSGQVANHQGSQNNKRKGNFSGSKNNKPRFSKTESTNRTACKKCGRVHLGECKLGTTACYRCGKEGHFARNCMVKLNTEDKQGHNRPQGQQLHAMQAKIEGPIISQGRLEAPEPTARIFAFTKNDAEAGNSNVITGQLLVANKCARVLFDSGATHSFASTIFAKNISEEKDKIGQTFGTVLPSGEILFSNYWLRAVPMVVAGRVLSVDLVILDMIDYDVILGMDFLGKYNVTIECTSKKARFNPPGEEQFEFVGEKYKSQKMMISAMKARKLIANG